MIIFRNTSKLLAWHHDVLGKCLRASPLSTTGLVAKNVLSRILYTITFFLPLKVILLAGGNGVPRYFQSFVAAEDKNLWIIALTAGAVLSYLLTLTLDFFGDVLAAKAAATFEGSPVVADTESAEESTTERLIARVCESHGDLWFVAIALGFGLFLNMNLFLFVLWMLLIEGLILGVVVNSLLKDGGSRTAVLYRYWPGWSGIFISVNFLLAFALLLVQFMALGYSNILVAMLSILLLRQMLGALSRYAQNGLWLWMWRDYVQAIFMSERKYEPAGVKRLGRLGRLFGRKVRAARMQERLERDLKVPLRLDAYRWLDPRGDGLLTFTFDVHVDGTPAPRRFYERVYFPAPQRRVQREVELEAAMPGGLLPRPALVSRETFENVVSAVSELGDGALAGPDDRDMLLLALLPELWRIRPTEALLRVWRRSGHSLEERLPVDLLRKMDLAADTPRAQNDLAALFTRHEQLLSAIRSIPSFVYNANMRWQNLYRRADGRPLLIDWGEWAVEPVGVGLLQSHHGDAHAQQLAAQAGLSLLDGSPLTADHLMLVAHSANLESWIRRRQLGLALEEIPGILVALDKVQH